MTVRRGLAALLVCAAAAGCTGRRPAAGPVPEPPPGPSSAAVFENRSFKLSKVPDPDLELALEEMLSASHEAAVKRHSGAEPMGIGFTYSLAPKGAVYPFSEIEVSCIMQQKYARRSGPGLCADFFSELERRIKKALADRQQVTQ